MKTRGGVPLNVGLFEAVARLFLMIPTGGLAVVAVIYLHTYAFLFVPLYFMATGLTYYSPVKHLYRLILHKPVFTGKNDPVLSSEVM